MSLVVITDAPVARAGAGSSYDAGHAELLLRHAGLRVTGPRRAVLTAVHNHPHSDTETVIRAARQGLPDVSHQAVYDVLRALTDVGLIRRTQPAGSVALYETRVGDNHHHIVCRSCGDVADVDCAAGTAPCLTAADHAGFVIDEAEVVFWGRCPACTAQRGTTTSPSRRRAGRERTP